MNIVIAGGGNVGRTIAKKLISEDHDVTIIEDDGQQIRSLNHELDALVIEGSAVDINILKKANIEKASLFIAVTNDDSSNLIASNMARRLSNKNLAIIGKVEKYKKYFNGKDTVPEDFSINMVIDPVYLSIKKILTLIEQPKAIENIDFPEEELKLIGIKINGDFEFSSLSLKEIALNNPLLLNIKIVAINRSDKVIIPGGNDRILTGDKIYVLGKPKDIQKFLKINFKVKSRFNNIIIIGSNKEGHEIARKLENTGRKITIIEEDLKKCEKLSHELERTLILNGSATDTNILDEIEIKNSCIVCTSSDDEYNIISAVTAKKYGAAKTICIIRNTNLVSIINSISGIDTVFSPHTLSIGKILQYCRKGNVVSVTSFSEMNAEIITLLISKANSITGKLLQEIKLPSGMIIGVIIRDGTMIIPRGKDTIELNDKVIIFILPESFEKVKKIFF